MQKHQLIPGMRVRTIKQWESFPMFILPAGKVGTIRYVSEEFQGVTVAFDDFDTGDEQWGNEVLFYDPTVEDHLQAACEYLEILHDNKTIELCADLGYIQKYAAECKRCVESNIEFPAYYAKRIADLAAKVEKELYVRRNGNPATKVS
jgi:hypothetical protein